MSFRNFFNSILDRNLTHRQRDEITNEDIREVVNEITRSNQSQQPRRLAPVKEVNITSEIMKDVDRLNVLIQESTQLMKEVDSMSDEIRPQIQLLMNQVRDDKLKIELYNQNGYKYYMIKHPHNKLFVLDTCQGVIALGYTKFKLNQVELAALKKILNFKFMVELNEYEALEALESILTREYEPTGEQQ